MVSEAKRRHFIAAATECFDTSAKAVFNIVELKGLLYDNREAWGLSRTSADELVEILLKGSDLKQITLKSANYPEINRFCWKDPFPLSLALSLRPNAYLSHITAVFLHGLTELLPQSIFINKEQGEKYASETKLTQEAITRAFSSSQRKSNYVFRYADWRITLLSGKQTRRFGVGRVEGPNGEQLDVTDLERTLVDIAVRPGYAGGVYQVLATYRAAAEKLSLEKLFKTLVELDYRYPYHQAIGFYLQRAGFDLASLAAFKDLGLQFNFFLAHGLKETELDPTWRLFVPKGF